MLSHPLETASSSPLRAGTDGGLQLVPIQHTGLDDATDHRGKRVEHWSILALSKRVAHVAI